MIVHGLLVAHILVLGYWLGAELVINSSFRLVSYAEGMPRAARERLLAHVMDADQHVRYALVLQAGLGTMLAALHGHLPGGGALAVAASVCGAAWLALVELTHRWRTRAAGRVLSRADYAVRHALMLALLAAGALSLNGVIAAPPWLAWKLVLFAGVILCGVGIRWALVRYFALWAALAERGADPGLEAALRRGYWQATAILLLLWVLIAGITVLSVLKPDAA